MYLFIPPANTGYDKYKTVGFPWYEAPPELLVLAIEGQLDGTIGAMPHNPYCKYVEVVEGKILWDTHDVFLEIPREQPWPEWLVPLVASHPVSRGKNKWPWS